MNSLKRICIETLKDKVVKGLFSIDKLLKFGSNPEDKKALSITFNQGNNIVQVTRLI